MQAIKSVALALYIVSNVLKISRAQGFIFAAPNSRKCAQILAYANCFETVISTQIQYR